MTQVQIEKLFQKWQPKVLIIGTVKFSDGTWGLNSIVCQTKQDVYKAVSNFQSFDVFFLKKSKEGADFYRLEALKYGEIVKTLENEGLAT